MSSFQGLVGFCQPWLELNSHSCYCYWQKGSSFAMKRGKNKQGAVLRLDCQKNLAIQFLLKHPVDYIAYSYYIDQKGDLTPLWNYKILGILLLPYKDYWARWEQWVHWTNVISWYTVLDCAGPELIQFNFFSSWAWGNVVCSAIWSLNTEKLTCLLAWNLDLFRKFQHGVFFLTSLLIQGMF